MQHWPIVVRIAQSCPQVWVKTQPCRRFMSVNTHLLFGHKHCHLHTRHYTPSTMKMPANRWEHFAHEADMGVRGFGASKARAFEQAALGLTAVITDPQTVQSREIVKINCEAPDDELLFVDWLNALVYEMAMRNMLFSQFEVEIEGQRLTGKASGEKVDVTRHQPAVEIKGATYTALSVSRDESGTWVAQCVVDV